jgi:hypothetical protein
MTYNIIETSGLYPNTRKNILAGADSLANAIALAHNMFVIIDLERDPLNQLCADFYTSTGRVMSIEPSA